MSDFVNSSNALRQVLQGFTALPLYWPNDDRAPTPEDAPNGFVYSESRLQDERRITLSAPTSRRRDFGEFYIIVYVPRGTLVGTAETYAQQIRALFSDEPVEGLFVTRKMIEAGDTVDGPTGRVYAVPLRIDWYSDRME